MAEIRFSIVIPVYNLEQNIEKTLTALLATGLNESELIIVDDGSADHTVEIINNSLMKSNISYRILSQQNGGVSKARNIGIGEAQGEYIIFFDGDDSCDAKLIHKADKLCENHPDMAIWRFNCVDSEVGHISQESFDKEEYGRKEFLEQLLKGNFRIRIGSFAVKRNIIIDSGICFTEGCSFGEDVEFIYKLVLSSSSFKTTNDSLYNYIKREGSAANQYDLNRFQAPMAIRRIYDFAMTNCAGELDEFCVDYLKYGLLLTHSMYSFDSCCSHIKGIESCNNFINEYFAQYKDVETLICEAVRKSKYNPLQFSKRRLAIFKKSRRIYAFYKLFCHIVGKD